MGQLDEKAFEQAISGCPRCQNDLKAFEVSTYLDRHITCMLADANDSGRWAHDGEKFIDGIYRVTCMSCKAPTFESSDCPRCHAPGVLDRVLTSMSKMTPPMRCPTCRGTETSIVGFARATVIAGGDRRAAPTPVALFGDPGFHIVAIACDSCDWAQVAEGCPLCGHTGQLRARP